MVARRMLFSSRSACWTDHSPSLLPTRAPTYLLGIARQPAPPVPFSTYSACRIGAMARFPFSPIGLLIAIVGDCAELHGETAIESHVVVSG